MPQAGIFSRKIGSIGPRLGIYEFARDGARIDLVNFHRSVQVGAETKKDQEPYLDLRVRKDQILSQCSSPGWGVLIRSEVMPKQLSDQVASQGEKFAATFDHHCRWLLFLPRIEAQGEPVAGFELTMAEATQNEIETFLKGIDQPVGLMLRQEIDRTIFLNPTFIESVARSEEYWISTLGFLTGKVMLKSSRETAGG